MIPSINIDTILSDPMLIAGSTLLVIGPLVFIIALIKLILLSVKKPKAEFRVPEPEKEFAAPDRRAPEFDVEQPNPAAPPPPLPAASEDLEKAIQQELSGSKIMLRVESPNPPSAQKPMSPMSDKTMVITQAEADLQAQIDIVIAQLKNLNKKMGDMEDKIDAMEKHAEVRIEPNELKDPPANAADYMQKLLKLAEHVIVLEKEVGRLRSRETSNTSASPTRAKPAPSSTPPKPPIMPV